MTYQIRDFALRVVMALALTGLLFAHGTSFAHEVKREPAELTVCVKRAVGPRHPARFAREKTFCRKVEVERTDPRAEATEQASEKASS